MRSYSPKEFNKKKISCYPVSPSRKQDIGHDDGGNDKKIEFSSLMSEDNK